MLLAALVILAVAHPLLNPQPRLASTGPIILVVDDGWAAAHDWPARQAALAELLAQAEREDRQVVLVTTAPTAVDEAPAPLRPVRAVDAGGGGSGIVAQTVACRPARPRSLASKHSPCRKRVRAIWLSDGIADDGGDRGAGSSSRRTGELALSDGATRRGARLCSLPGDAEANDVGVALCSLPVPTPRLFQVRASGDDGRLLARQASTIEPGAKGAELRLAMPSELRNRMTRIEVEGDQSAGRCC